MKKDMGDGLPCLCTINSGQVVATGEDETIGKYVRESLIRRRQTLVM